jgi:hypothetical protein
VATTGDFGVEAGWRPLAMIIALGHERLWDKAGRPDDRPAQRCNAGELGAGSTGMLWQLEVYLR